MLFDNFKRKRINNTTIKKDCDSVAKHVRRATAKKLRKGMLPDGHSLAEHLNYVDKSYSHIKEDINNTTLMVDYERLRGERFAVTEQMLNFYQVKYDELQKMYENIAKEAKDMGRRTELSGEKLRNIDIEALRSKFEQLDRKESVWEGDK